MNRLAKDRLYNLLPAIYRMADARQGKPLRALLRVIEEQMNALEDDIDRLYEDWFIETCDDWVIPYIGDLLGIEGMQHFAGEWNLRSYVANALAYRRRKGTAAVLERVASDVTGWQAHSVEFFRLTAATQNLLHLRPASLQSPDLKDSSFLDSIEGPFGNIPHTVDVRKIRTGRGRYNIANIGIFLWRLQSYEVDAVNARRLREGCYTFDPTGLDLPLFHQPKNDELESLLSDESDFCAPLRFPPLRRELKAMRQDNAALSDKSLHYFSNPPVISIKLDVEISNGAMESARVETSVPYEFLEICDLSEWQEGPEVGWDGWTQRSKLAIDPRLGRLSISENILNKILEKKLENTHFFFLLNTPRVKSVLVSYSYGFSGDIGAGPYDRTEAIREVMGDEVNWQACVTKDPAIGGNVFSTLTQALVEWKNLTDSRKLSENNIKPEGKNKECPYERTIGLIAIMDSRTYQEDVTIEIPEACQLLIVAASITPSVEQEEAPFEQLSRKRVMFSAGMLRPHFWGNMNVIGTAGEDSENSGELVINGLLMEGELRVQEGNLGSLIVANSTIVPGKGGIKTYSQGKQKNDGLKLALNKSICGKIELMKSVPSLLIRECIIDALSQDDTAIKAEGSEAIIEESTILGMSCISSLHAYDCIFTGMVSAKQKQVGYVRFSYLPFGSITPRRFNCQPDTIPVGDLDRTMEKFANRIHPAFNSLHYPDPAYAQLSASSPKEISAGTEDGFEIGVFKSLKQPQRLANLDAALQEYLPIELEAGIFFMT